MPSHVSCGECSLDPLRPGPAREPVHLNRRGRRLKHRDYGETRRSLSGFRHNPANYPGLTVKTTIRICPGSEGKKDR